MLTLLGIPTLLVLTVFWGTAVLLARLVGVRPGPGSIYERAPRAWARGMLFVSGVRVVVHGAERMTTGEPRIFVANHVSWYDVLVLVAYLPRYSFVAKAELFRVPIFGGAARAVGVDGKQTCHCTHSLTGARCRPTQNKNGKRDEATR